MSPSHTFSPLASRAELGVSRLSSSAWACRSKRRQRLHPVREEFSCGKIILNNAFQFLHDGRRGARLAQAVENELCGLLCDANLFPKLHAGDAFPSGDEQVHGIEPLVERHFTALENGSRADGEIEIAASVAAVEANPLASRDSLAALAVRTDNAVRPEARFQVQSRCFLIREGLEELKGTDRGAAHLLPAFPETAMRFGCWSATLYAQIHRRAAISNAGCDIGAAIIAVLYCFEHPRDPMMHVTGWTFPNGHLHKSSESAGYVPPRATTLDAPQARSGLWWRSNQTSALEFADSYHVAPRFLIPDPGCPRRGEYKGRIVLQLVNAENGAVVEGLVAQCFLVSRKLRGWHLNCLYRPSLNDCFVGFHLFSPAAGSGLTDVIVDESRVFVKNYSRREMKELGTYVYNSPIFHCYRGLNERKRSTNMESARV